jgi:trk system potassium uptake protein TrkA
VALNLARHGQSVLAIDLAEEEADELAGELDAVVRADATDEKALRELRVDRIPTVVVAIGAQAMEASILTTALLRQLGVSRIVARALTELHARVLHAVGAHDVVSPEAEMGERLARRLAQPNVLERLELGDSGTLAEVEVPEAFVGQSLRELDVRRRYDLTVLAIRRQGSVLSGLSGNEKLSQGDLLVVLGSPDAISGIANLA